MAAILLGMTPYNLREALADDNLPRALATALLPALTYCLLRLAHEHAGRRYAVAGALLLAAVILSHAMMGAIFGAGLGLLAILLFVLRGATMRGVLHALGMLAGGLAFSGAWLLLILSGGISDLNQQAVTEALGIFLISTSLNPRYRFDDHAIIYVLISVALTS